MKLEPGMVIRPTAIHIAIGRESQNVVVHLTTSEGEKASILLRPEQAFALQDMLEEVLGKPDQRPGYQPKRPERLS